MSRQSRLQSARGAIIIHVALALMAMLVFTSVVIDYGVMWVSRRQAQNVVDSAALAGGLGLMWGGSPTQAAQHFAATNPIWGQGNSAGNVDVTLSDATHNIPPCNLTPGCVRVDVFRNAPDRANVVRGNAIPTYFARLVNLDAQRVRATATAHVGAGNRIKCLLPFSVIDRWADNYDPTPVTTYFPNDGLTGTAGWSPNDEYQKPQGDVYIGPYNGNTNHTGWRVTTDYGRQLILKTGLGTYSNGWANLVYLPGSNGANDLKNDIEGCNPQGVGISTLTDPCNAADFVHGCLDIKTGTVQGPVRMGVQNLVGQDSAAAWNPTADGPNGPGTGAVVGGQGMTSPRIRGIAIVDIDHFIASGCSGGLCIAKVANIIGFFVEGMCNTVTLDPGLVCEDPTKMVVGRIVTLPSTVLAGVGNVESSAAFLKVVRLVR